MAMRRITRSNGQVVCLIPLEELNLPVGQVVSAVAVSLDHDGGKPGLQIIVAPPITEAPPEDVPTVKERV